MTAIGDRMHQLQSQCDISEFDIQRTVAQHEEQSHIDKFQVLETEATKTKIQQTMVKESEARQAELQRVIDESINDLARMVVSYETRGFELQKALEVQEAQANIELAVSRHNPTHIKGKGRAVELLIVVADDSPIQSPFSPGQAVPIAAPCQDPHRESVYEPVSCYPLLTNKFWEMEWKKDRERWEEEYRNDCIAEWEAEKRRAGRNFRDEETPISLLKEDLHGELCTGWNRAWCPAWCPAWSREGTCHKAPTDESWCLWLDEHGTIKWYVKGHKSTFE